MEGVVNKDRDNEKFYAAKMLARHMDLLLKKQSKNRSNDLEDKLDEAVIIFRYIKDKDTFHKVRIIVIIVYDYIFRFSNDCFLFDYSVK